MTPHGLPSGEASSTHNPLNSPELEAFTLPPALEATVADASRAFGVNRDLAIGVALGTLSATVMDKLQLVDDDGETTAGNLFVCSSALSGTGKSRTFSRFTQPLQDYQNFALEQFSTHTAPGLRAELSVLEGERRRTNQKNGIPRKERQEILADVEARIAELQRELEPPRIMCEDVTVQRLAMLMQRDECISLFSGDARDVLLNLGGRHNDGKPDEGIFLKGFSMEACTIDRVGRQSIVLNRPCLSLNLVVTPDAIDTLFQNERLKAGGFLPRCLFIQSATRPQVRRKGASGPQEGVWRAWTELLVHLTQTYRKAQSPAVVQCTEEASDIFRAYWNEFAEGIMGEINPFNARVVELSKRIAVCLHAATHGKAACKHPISADTAGNARLLMDDLFITHRDRIINGAEEEQIDAMLSRLDDILMRSGGRIGLRDLQRRHAFTGRKLAMLERAVEVSEAFKWEEYRPESGRPGKYLIFANA